MRVLLTCASLLVFALSLQNSYSQNPFYWSANLNAEASLLSGAVVGGNAGVTAIYYNPAQISDGENSSFAINANIGTLDHLQAKNLLGDGVDVNNVDLGIQPRFIALAITPPKELKVFSIQVASLTRNENEIELNEGGNQPVDIFPDLPGEEIYSPKFEYKLRYNDAWYGLGAAYQFNESLSLGFSMFTSFKTVEYRYSTRADIFPQKDTIWVGGEPVPFFNYNANRTEFAKISSTSLLWKFGLFYQKDRWGFGLNITTPSLELFSSGNASKHFSKNQGGDGGTPDFIITDQNESLKGSLKDPLSIALGITYRTADFRQEFYFSTEYFSGIEPYKMITGTINPHITTEETWAKLINKEWLTYVNGAQPVVNSSLAYKREMSDNLSLMGGFRTDFNYLKGVDYGDLGNHQKFERLLHDLYHLTFGARFNILKHNVIFGIQYSVAREKGLKQFTNFTSPFDPNEEDLPYFGFRKNNVDLKINSLAAFFGITLEFKTKGGKSSSK